MKLKAQIGWALGSFTTAALVGSVGHDVRWRNADYKAVIPGVEAMPEGEAPDADVLPVLWQRAA